MNPYVIPAGTKCLVRKMGESVKFRRRHVTRDDVTASTPLWQNRGWWAFVVQGYEVMVKSDAFRIERRSRDLEAADRHLRSINGLG